MTSPRPFHIHDLMKWVGLEEAHRDALRSAWPSIEPRMSQVLSTFYDRILAHPVAGRVLSDAGVSVDQLKGHLKRWVQGLLCDTFDDNYFERQWRLGVRHVEVSLPHPLMVTGASVLRTELKALLPPASDTASRSLDRSLDVSMAIMLLSYEEDRNRISGEKVLLENEHMIALGRMSASIAHEIRNPLAGISGAVQVLRSEADEGDPRREVMDGILEQVQRLSSTVKDLLDFARPMKLALQDVRLTDIIESVRTLFAKDPAFRMELRFQDEATRNLRLHVDPLRLQSVFINLFTNANEASEGGGVVMMSSRSIPGRVEISLKDDGPGIPVEWHPHLFKPFVTHKVHGTGLGLAICRKIIENHGGTIVHRPSDSGAQFVITFPEGGLKT